MNQLCEIASDHGIAVIEDACRAHGAAYKGKKFRSLGDVGRFSFSPSKNMTVAGDGGTPLTRERSARQPTMLQSR
jgi:dTDP-4-amino-4,6-dideoxygalactose transaminase